MDIGKTIIEAGAVTFAFQYRYLDGGAPHTQGMGGAGGSNATQGVCVQVVGDVNGKETEILRFDCFDRDAHYHYGPENMNHRIMMDPILAGNPIGWTVNRCKNDLVDMIRRSGYEELAGKVDMKLVGEKMAEVEATARGMSERDRHYTRHNRGTQVIDAGNIKFGLEMRTVGPDGGPAIHILADVADQEIELIAVDCFRINPHYHYGPRFKNERIFVDTTLIPDSLQWMLDQFKAGKLPEMIEHSGYPTVAANMDRELVAEKVLEMETTIKAMAKADPR
ncbi:MAG: hypothetical protein ACE5Q6_06665 [Dehalococcoidia bacterium]